MRIPIIYRMKFILVVCVPRVRVRTIGPFIARLGFHQREVLLAGRTVRDLLRQLEGELGDRFRNAVLDEEGRLRPYIKVLVNGRGIHVSGGLDTPLSDGDVVAIFPPIAGGSLPL